MTKEKTVEILKKFTDQTTILRDVFANQVEYTVYNDWTGKTNFYGKTLYIALSKMYTWMKKNEPNGLLERER